MMNRLIICVVLLLLCGPLSAANPPTPSPPKLGAQSYILMDAESGVVLVEHNADVPLDPASITKLMTAYVVFKALKDDHIAMDDQVLVSEKAWRMEGSRMFIEVGKRVSVEELLKGMIIQSGNDASVALAEHVAGSEEAFANMMNAEARAMGLDNTHFTNATGLPAREHHTSARDIAILARHLIRDFPQGYELFSEREYTYNGITQHNRNRLLWKDDSVDGLKTGHTEAAGYCLVSSARRGEMRLISVVMGTGSDKARTTQSQTLLNYGFRFFETHKLYAGGEELARPRIWKGEGETLPVGTEQDLYVTVGRGRYEELDAHLEIDPQVIAPVGKGQAVGEVVVSHEGRELVRTELVALEDMPEGGLWRQAVDTVLLWLE